MANTIDVVLGLTTTGLQKGLKVANAALAKFGTNVTEVVSPGKRALRELSTTIEENKVKILAFSASVVASSGSAAVVAASYQREFSKITGLVGIAAAEVDRMAQSTLSLAGATGRGPQELAEAMFVVTSAGLRGAEALDTLELAAQGAAAGMGQTADLARSVAAATNAYGVETLSVARANDILAATARAGNFEVAGLSAAIGRVLPISAQLGLSFEEVGGAIALLTRGGLSAAESITAVRAILNSILSPSAEAAKALEAIGLSMDDVKNTLQNNGLKAALEQLYEATGRNDEAFAKLGFGAEALGSAFTIIGASAGETEATFGAVADSAGVLQEAFDAAANTAGFKFQAAMQEMKVAMIALGDVLLPVVAKLSEFAAFLVGTFAGAIQSLPGPLRALAAGFVTLLAAAGPLALALVPLANSFLFIKKMGLYSELLGFLSSGMRKLAGSAATANTSMAVTSAVTTKAATGFTALGAAANKASGGITRAVAAAGGIVRVLGTVAAAIGIGVVAYQTWNEQQQRAVEAERFWNEAMIGTQGTLGGRIADLQAMQESLTATTENVENLTRSFKGVKLQEAIGSETAETLNNLGISLDQIVKEADKFGPAFAEAGDQARAFGGHGGLVVATLDKMTFGMADNLTSGSEWAERIRNDLNPALVESGTVLDQLLDALARGDIDIDMFRELAADMENFLPAMTEAGNAVVRTQEEFTGFADSIGGVTDAMRTQALAQVAVNNGWFDLADALLTGDERLIDIAKAGVIASGAINEVGLEAQNAALNATLYGDATDLVADKLLQMSNATAKAKFDIADVDDSLKAVAIELTRTADGAVDYARALDFIAGATGTTGAELDALAAELLATEEASAQMRAGLEADFNEILDGPDLLIDKLAELQNIADDLKLEPDADFAEIDEALAKLVEELTGITEEEWVTYIEAETEDIDRDMAAVLLDLANIDQTTATALLDGEDEPLRQAVNESFLALDAVSKALAVAIITADNNNLIDAVVRSINALKALDQAIEATGLVTNRQAERQVFFERAYARSSRAVEENATANLALGKTFDTVKESSLKAAEAQRSAGGATSGGTAAAKEQEEQLIETRAQWDAWVDTLTEVQQAEANVALEDAKLRDSVENTNTSMTEAERQAKIFADAQKLLEGRLKDTADELINSAESTEELEEAAKEAEEALEDFRDEVDDLIESVKELAEENLDLAGTYGEIEDAVSAARDEIDAMNGIQKDVLESTIDWYDSLRDLQEQLGLTAEGNEDFVATLDLSTEAGSENTLAIIEAAEKSRDLALVKIAEGQAVQDVIADHEANTEAIIEAGVQAGFTEEEVRALVEIFGQLPVTTALDLEVDTEGPRQDLEDLIALKEEFGGETTTAKIEFDAQQARDEAGQVLIDLAEVDNKTAVATLVADGNPFTAVVSSALLQLVGFSEAEAEAILGGDDASLREALLAAGIVLDLWSKAEVRKEISADYSKAEVKIGEINAIVDAIPDANIVFDAETGMYDEVYARVTEGFKTITGPHVAQIEANADDAIADVDQVNTGLDEISVSRAAQIETGSVTAANAEAEKANVTLDGFTTPRAPIVPTGAITAADAAGKDLNNTLDNATRPRDAPISVSVSGAGGVEATLNNLARSRNASITVTTTQRTVYEQVGAPSIAAADRAINAANGGIFRGNVKSFASGGFNNDAHIAPPSGRGLIRYAEQETGGEAYIPLALSKRSRSESLVKQVARMFGGEVVGFADGGIIQQPNMMTGGVSSHSVTINAPVTINGTPGEDVDRAVQRGIENLERTVKMEMARA